MVIPLGIASLARPGPVSQSCSWSTISKPSPRAAAITRVIEDRLAFLAGLAHDAAKAAIDWQDYIRGGSAKGRLMLRPAQPSLLSGPRT